MPESRVSQEVVEALRSSGDVRLGQQVVEVLRQTRSGVAYVGLTQQVVEVLRENTTVTNSRVKDSQHVVEVLVRFRQGGGFQATLV